MGYGFLNYGISGGNAMEHSDDMARHRAHMPEGTASVLNTRTLQTAHKRLAELLQPGMRILDVACGTGAITCGIAEVVGEQGRVVGVDINTQLIEQARQAQNHLPQLFYEVYDLYQLP